MRGGSWNNDNPENFRASNRNNNHPTNRNNNVGFRCAKTREPPCSPGTPRAGLVIALLRSRPGRGFPWSTSATGALGSPFRDSRAD